jgi:hypothetical protein
VSIYSFLLSIVIGEGQNNQLFKSWHSQVTYVYRCGRRQCKLRFGSLIYEKCPITVSSFKRVILTMTRLVTRASAMVLMLFANNGSSAINNFALTWDFNNSFNFIFFHIEFTHTRTIRTILCICRLDGNTTFLFIRR